MVTLVPLCSTNGYFGSSLFYQWLLWFLFVLPMVTLVPLCSTNGYLWTAIYNLSNCTGQRFWNKIKKSSNNVWFEQKREWYDHFFLAMFFSAKKLTLGIDFTKLHFG
jgi:hypothetical protein